MTGSLYCGAAKGKITPEASLLPKLYGLMQKRFCMVHDDIFLRVLYLTNQSEQALLVGFDLDKAVQPEKYIKLLSEATGVPNDHILYFAIHTHTAPLTGPRKPFEQPPDEEAAEATAEYEGFLLEKLLKAAKQAMGSPVPVKIGIGYGNSFINANRNQIYHYTAPDGRRWDYPGNGLNPEGVVDHTAAVARFEDTNGVPVAFFVNYAVHNVAMICNDADGKGRVAISADIGGNVSKFLEESTGAVALWSSGAAGDINPVMLNQFAYSDPVTGERRVYEPVGDEAAKAALKVMSTRHYDDIRQIERSIRCEEVSGIIRGSQTYACAPLREGEGEYRVLLQALRIGNLLLIGSSGELYTSLGKVLRGQSDFPHTLVINHNRSLIADCGYVYDDETSALFDESCPVRGELPGGGRGRTAPGTIKPALVESVRLLLREIGTT